MAALDNYGEIEPASFAQLNKGRDGKMILIEDDVGNVARDLREIDPRLRVRYSEAGEYFVVYLREDWQDPGDGYLVTTAQELDQRIVERIRKINSEHYDYVAEIERLDSEAEAEKEKKVREDIEEIAERLSFALRKERGFDKHRAFL